MCLRMEQMNEPDVHRQPSNNLRFARGDQPIPGTYMTREARSSSELQTICLEKLKACPGFENVDEIAIQPRDTIEDGANWTLAAVRPRVDNKMLRAARGTIEMLQRSYQLHAADAIPQVRRRQRA